MALDWLHEHMLTCLFDGPDPWIATSQPLKGDDKWFAAMRLELEEIAAFKVATICKESAARSIATKRVHTTWSIWLGLEVCVGEQLCLGSELFLRR